MEDVPLIASAKSPVPETHVVVTALNLTFSNIFWLVFAISVSQAMLFGIGALALHRFGVF